MLRTRKLSGILGGVAAVFPLAAATLSNFSALGTAPLTLQWSYPDYIAGYYGQIQIDQTSSAFSNITQNIIFFIDGASWALNDEAIGLSTPSGQYWARIRVCRDNEGGATTVAGNDPLGSAVSFNADVSPWSNTFTDTINASVAALNTVTGANKSQWLTITGTPALSFSGAAGNSRNTVRSTVEQASTKAQFELTIGTETAANFGVGVDDGTTDLNATTVAPGYENSAGILVEFFGGTDIYIDYNARATQIVLATGVANVYLTGDVFTPVFDKSAHTMEVWRTRSGTTVQIGSTGTGLPTLTHYFAIAATLNSTASGTLNFGGSAYAKTPGTGVALIWA